MVLLRGLGGDGGGNFRREISAIIDDIVRLPRENELTHAGSRHYHRKHAAGPQGEAVARWVYDIASKRSDAAFEIVDIKDFTDIPQIALGFSLILPPFRSSNKAEPLRMAADPSDFGPPPRSALKDAGPAFIQTHLSREYHRTRNCRTHYAVDATGGGRSSAIIRRMSAKRFLGMATSAI